MWRWKQFVWIKRTATNHKSVIICLFSYARTVFRCFSYWWPRAWCCYQIISPGVRPKTLSVSTAAQTKTKNCYPPSEVADTVTHCTYWIFTTQKLVCKQMFIRYDLTTVSWLYVWHSTYFFMYYSCILFLLYCFLLFICVRLTRDLINATYLLTYLPTTLHEIKQLNPANRLQYQ